MDPRGRRWRIVLGWIRALARRAVCAHAWRRDPEGDHFIATGPGYKQGYVRGVFALRWICPRCGSTKEELSALPDSLRSFRPPPAKP